MNHTPLTVQARLFSIAAHSAVGQVRKYTGEPYYTHPEAVARILVDLEDPAVTEQMIAAAYLHDVVEDTAVTHSIVSQCFGTSVSFYVQELTDQFSDPSHGNRAARKALECERLARVMPKVQTIKLADLIHNSESIFKHDPGFAAVYLKEKKALLRVLDKGHPALLRRAWAIIDQYEVSL